MTILSFGAALAFGPLNRYAIDICIEPMGRRIAVFASYTNFFGVIATGLTMSFYDKKMDDLSLLISICAIIAFIIFQLAKKYNIIAVTKTNYLT